MNKGRKEIDMTKLLILGAAGDMGSYALKLSTKFDLYTHITLGDINEKRARELMEEIKDPRLDFERVDAYNHDELVKLMQQYDIIISAIGPFYIFGPLVTSAAIKSRRPLIDICDDYGPTIEILKMDEDAKEIGVPIFLGYGWTPGTTNILTRYGYNKLDKDSPIKCNISWAGGAADSEGLAVVLHVLYAVTGKVPSYLNGKMIDVLAGDGFEKVEFPAPLNDVTVFDCGHPEPVTIPKYLENIEECTLKGGLTPEWNNNFAAGLKGLGLINTPKMQKFFGKIIHKFEAIFEKGGGIEASSARVDLWGKLDGKNVHLAYATPSIPMGELTGYPAAITAKLFAEGKISGTGIIPPEVQDPKLFLDELEKIGIKMVYDDDGQLKRLKKNRKIQKPKGKHIAWSALLVLLGLVPLAIIATIIALLIVLI
ncbi:MAG: saccharopine dehydrogenase NADP-binding domain-containing protein [Candidatus Lokiarchaeota archaeon]|nr:saccharopine dehydrogenase NADP-binding domain-containing protein [Candidatus Lokiarchaeota archaeon]